MRAALQHRTVEIVLTLLILLCLFGQWETGFRPALPKKGDFPMTTLCQRNEECAFT